MTSRVPRLVSVGNVIVDILARVPALPERGSDVLASSSGMSAGGSFNTMVAAVRQGLPTAYAGGHGSGPFGDLVREALERAGIETLLPASKPLDTGYDVALVDDGGERTFVTAFGAEAHLGDQFDALPIVLEERDLVHVSGYGLLPGTNGPLIVDWLGRIPSGNTVLVDPGPLVADVEPGVWSAALARTDWFSCNEREAAILTGETDPRAAVGILLASLSREGAGVLLRLGAEGCLLAVGDGVQQVPGFSVAAVDTNGAGDAHAGAFLAGLAEGLAPPAAALRANVCAALAVTRPGPATAPTRADVVRALALIS